MCHLKAKGVTRSLCPEKGSGRLTFYMLYCSVNESLCARPAVHSVFPCACAPAGTFLGFTLGFPLHGHAVPAMLRDGENVRQSFSVACEWALREWPKTWEEMDTLKLIFLASPLVLPGEWDADSPACLPPALLVAFREGSGCRRHQGCSPSCAGQAELG